VTALGLGMVGAILTASILVRFWAFAKNLLL